ncbi:MULTISPECIES: hypothetical protein [Methylobacterium]|jgi:hypothetical protein|uniref:Uncharacterized protein n=1 Tax=Methylobacterium jeotgali TaxID=381630 RepID=A0ABQ4SWC6_9HYPH|nr:MULTISPECIES: hypothetical protein [Methylobacterium]PIU05668.1 MAG: hypothetical protein COT56_13570 [Methylobacterium sp. CG09_land_8_20_14_0_10_71_15]PIU12378.1 MAG: hypothetical protein COT28_15415 [Methylobacterium sp. CG08_land_8_20_14_0_20_71_15]GBU16890.1 hypothetical protein AwMethylo_11050 [Methylobacterium sp.]GJE06844.1 hypothetical protein AOPFMNJM_2166 [Methylobacterium jeotgali]
MKTEIKDEVGVTMAGPDNPALAAAKARDLGGDAYLRYTDECRSRGEHALCHEDWAEGHGGKIDPSRITVGRAVLSTGSVGDVSRLQAGILPAGQLSVSDAMVERAQREGADCGQLLDRRVVRAMLEAALRG